VRKAPLQSDGYSFGAAVTDDGRYVVFCSNATTLVPEETNDLYQVYLRDMIAGTTVLLSRSASGVAGDRDTYSPTITPDGRYAAFESDSTNLVPGDVNDERDIFVRDLQAGTIALISVDASSGPLNSGSYYPSMTPDGRYVAFASWASNVVAGDTNGTYDIYLRDTVAGTTILVSANSSGALGNDESMNPRVSSDGRYVAFWSLASNLVGGDSTYTADIFVRDTVAGTTICASVLASGLPANSWCGFPSISADGRFVAFDSYADNLVPGDANGLYDVFIRDTVAGTTVRASVDSAGGEGGGNSAAPAISGDGRYVVYSSESVLAAGDSNGNWDVFLRDSATGVTSLASVDSSGLQGDNYSFGSGISSNGRYVVFISQCTDLVPDDTNSVEDIFVRDLLAGSVALASVASTLGPGDLGSSNPSLSADGRHVAFVSLATNLVPGDTNGTKDIFRRDLVTGTTVRVSVSGSGAEANGPSFRAAISSDGRYVAFSSQATNLVSGDTNAMPDVFVRDLLMGTTVRISVDSAGTQGNGISDDPTISADGRYVAFTSFATNLIPGDFNNHEDVFVRDLATGVTSAVSIGSTGALADEGGSEPSMSADGRYVAFQTRASNLVSGDTNGSNDIFVRDRAAGTTIRVSVDSSGAQGNSDSFNSCISGDGLFVAFASEATNLVPGDTNSREDIFVRNLQANSTVRASVASSGAQGDGDSRNPSISADGRFVAFESLATNLAAGDGNAEDDLFVRDLIAGVTVRLSLDSDGIEGDGPSESPILSADGRIAAFCSSASNFTSEDSNESEDIFIRGPLH
jgi:Tol biopolymer transport system component